MRIIKTVYNDKTKWLTIKATLAGIEGINTIFPLGQLPKPPATEEDDWSVYSRYAVDLITEDSFDVVAAGLDSYLAPIPKDVLHFMHSVTSSVQIPIEFTLPDISWTKALLEAFCDRWNIQYSASWTKQQIVDAINNGTYYN